MKNKIIALLLLAGGCFFIKSLVGMKMQPEAQNRMKKRMQSERKTALEKQRLLKIVWIKTFDNQLIGLPLWHIEQMNVLHESFLQQEESNSKENPIDASIITFEELMLLQQAFEKIIKGGFNEWYKDMRDEFEKSMTNKLIGEGELRKLTNSAEKVGAKSLSAILAMKVLPQDITGMIGLEVIAPVINYIKNINNNIKRLQPNYMVVGDDNGVRHAQYSTDGSFIVSQQGSRSLIMWDAQLEQQKENFSTDYLISSIALSSDNKYMACGVHLAEKNEQALLLWNILTKKYKHLGSNWWFSSTGHSSQVNCIAFNPQNTFIVSGARGSENNLILWSISGQQIKVLEGHKEGVTCVAFSPDGNYIASGSYDKKIVLWDGKTGDLLNVFEGHNDAVECLAFSFDSKKIISGSVGIKNTLIFWDIDTKSRTIINEPKGSINSVAFSPDNEFIIAGGGLALILLDAHTGQIIHDYKFPSVIGAVAFSPDSSCFAAGTLRYKKNIIIGDVQTKECTYFDISKNITCLAFNPKHGNRLLIGSNNVDHPEDSLILLHLYDKKALENLEKKCTLAQAQLLYRLYIAKISNETVQLHLHDVDYVLFQQFDKNVQNMLKDFFPIEVPRAPMVELFSEKMKKSTKK